MGPRGREGEPFRTLTIFKRAFEKVLYQRKEIRDAAKQRRGRRRAWRIPHPRTEGRTGGGGRTGDGAITPSSSPSFSSSSPPRWNKPAAHFSLYFSVHSRHSSARMKAKRGDQEQEGKKRLFLFIICFYLAHRTLPAVMSERTCPKYYWPPPPVPCYPSFPSAASAASAAAGRTNVRCLRRRVHVRSSWVEGGHNYGGREEGGAALRDRALAGVGRVSTRWSRGFLNFMPV